MNYEIFRQFKVFNGSFSQLANIILDQAAPPGLNTSKVEDLHCHVDIDYQKPHAESGRQIMIKPCPFEDKSCTGAVCLSTLGVGQRGRVVDVDSGTAFSNRLLELGFVPGTLVEIRRRAPLMDPIELELRGVRICLRRTEVCRIAVELL